MIDDFRLNLARINALAEVSPGSVWRLQEPVAVSTRKTVLWPPTPAPRRFELAKYVAEREGHGDLLG